MADTSTGSQPSTLMGNLTDMARDAMGAATSAEPKGLADLMEHALKDIYYAEKKIYKSLPKMIKAAQDSQLQQLLTQHRDETGQQIEMLEQVFEAMGKRAQAERCDAIDGILEEGDHLLSDFGGTKAGDAAIIFSAQAVEHYEITRYGSIHAYATALGHQNVAGMIETILGQEKAADEKLTALAEGRINAAAA